MVKEEGKVKRLRLITLTVNNICNLNCPHCYLQLKDPFIYIERSIIQKVLNSKFEHVAIVGKEPLVNEKSINLLLEFAKNVKSLGRTISIITNGKNLDKIGPELLENIDYIDISFDGGKKTYNKIRKGSNFEKLKRDIQRLYYDYNYHKINALHTIHSQNIEDIEDLMSITEIIPFKTILFSPYLETENYGKNSVSRLDLKKLIKRLFSNKKFLEIKQTILNVDIFHLEQANLSVEDLIDFIENNNFKDKIIVYDKDLLYEGVIRVTHSGMALTPRQSLNPKKYSKGLKLEDFSNVNEVWRELVKNSTL
ncbi:radical SAM protein [Candidatus Woesearchaeota archaeon]|nr:radical SAM protein [Candidatus Woesearchaeota archaeon]